ncbi:MAG: FAD-binding oxidoreductase [Euryarchaeota archaeon]|nr:FAD-binding oxidoreductase [Euryarchaeota archaeon]
MAEGVLAQMAAEGRLGEGWRQRVSQGQDPVPLPRILDLLFNTTPHYLARPTGPEEVSELVRFAATQRLPIVPRGAGSWSAGGAIPVSGGMVIQTDRMASVEIDKEGMTATAGAGAPMAELQKAAQAQGLQAAPQPLYRPRSTLGGFLASGGLGAGSLKYGPLARQVAECQAVLPGGEPLTGDSGVASLISGSEGMLGVLTRATLRLHPKAEETRPVTFTFRRLEEAAEALVRIHKTPLQPLYVSLGGPSHYHWLLQDKGEFQGAIHVAVMLEGPRGRLAREEAEVKRAAGPRASPGSSELALREQKALGAPLHVPADRRGPGTYTFFVREHLVPLDRIAAFAGGLQTLGRRMRLHTGYTGISVDPGTLLVQSYHVIDTRRIFSTLLSLGYPKRASDLALELGGRPLGFGLWGTGMLEKLHGEMADPLADAKAMALGPTILRVKQDGAVEATRKLKKALDPQGHMNPGKVTELWLSPMGLLPIKLPALAMNLLMETMATGRRLMPQEKFTNE